MNKFFDDTVKEVYIYLLDVINDIYDNVGCKNFSKQEYNEIVLKVLQKEELKQIKRELIYECFEKILIKELDTIIKNKSENVISKMDKYINDEIDLYSDSLGELINFCLYITSNNIKIDEGKIVKLLKTNNKINKLLERIFDEYRDLIINDHFNIISTNATALFIIDVYCMLNNVNNQIEDFNIEKNDLRNYDDNFKIFMNEIDKYPLLTDYEVCILKEKILKGDREAKKTFINSNLKLVVNVAHKYQNNGLELLDLIQEGSIGLMRSIETFDPTLGFKFSSYAVRGIKTAIFRAIGNTSRNIRIPAYLSYEISKYLKAVNDFTSINGRPPTMEELEQITQIKKEKLNRMQEYTIDTISYNIMIQNGYDTETEMLELISNNEETPEDIILKKDLTERLKKMFKQVRLTQREIEILTLYFGLDGKEPMMKHEIGKKYNLSRERIRQIIESTLRKIRNSNAVYGFSNYMDNPKQVKQNIKKYREKYLLIKKGSKK